MNTDDFEKRLQQQPLRKLPADWKSEILGEARASARLEPPQLSWLEQCWQELFWSCRRAWFGLAAVWGVILLLNVAPSATPSVTVAATRPSSVEFVQAFQAKQKQIMAELGTMPLPDMERPRPHLPQPHSERRLAMAYV